jgi:nucleoside-diphosphate-sugar epimerase
MRQRNWACDVSDAQRDFGFHADYPLERGIHYTVEAYLQEKRNRKNRH